MSNIIVIYLWLLDSAAKREVFIPGAEQASIILPKNGLVCNATADKQLALRIRGK
jgi:hypothetical protein